MANFDYYPSGLLKQERGPGIYPSDYEYDAQGRLRKLTTWRNSNAGTGAQTTEWIYHPQTGFLAAKQYQSGPSIQYGYTAAGRLQDKTNGRNILRSFVRNNAGDIKDITYSDGTPAVHIEYDRLGRSGPITRAGMTSTPSYNSAWQLESEAFTGGELAGLTVKSPHDASLRPAGPILQGYNATSHVYTYDHAGRLWTVSDGGLSDVLFYAADGQGVAKGSVLSIVLFYRQSDPLLRLLGLCHAPCASNSRARAIM